MNAYVDSSVLLRILLNEPNPLKSFKKISLGVSSELIRVECLRVIDRLRLKGAFAEKETTALLEGLHRACASLELVRVSPLILGMAGQPYPTPVRTLDAVHLSSALLWSQSREVPFVFLTHDTQLGTAAKALGFVVEG